MVAILPNNDTKTPQSPLDFSNQEPEGSLSFSSLLQGISDTQIDSKLVQNGSFVLALQKNQLAKGANDAGELPFSLQELQTLSKEELDMLKEDAKTLQLNPAITQSMDVKELKMLIMEAKRYLKNKIVQLEGFKKAEIKALPKTLKGLVQVAKKFGIDISKITLQEVRQEATKLPEVLQANAPQKNDVKTTKKTVSSDVDTTDTLALKVKKEHKSSSTQDANFDFEVQEQVKKAKKVLPITTPLFKEQQSVHKITTEQLVSTKVMQELHKPQKQRDQNTLELLLRGEKAAKQDTTLTKDFVTATARVVAPTAKTEQQKNLENLLQGEGEAGSNTSKTEAPLHVKNAESFDVKLNEAKQMMKYLSHDVKQAIEEYKAPFTRVKVQLNPQNLGQMDLTVVQRGKNLHVNLTSNNAAINILAMNANDLKVQLQHNGIQNASLNFNSGSQSEQNGASSQQHQHNQHNHNAQEEYGYFDLEETQESVMHSLEIIVPRYV